MILFSLLVSNVIGVSSSFDNSRIILLTPLSCSAINILLLSRLVIILEYCLYWYTSELIIPTIEDALLHLLVRYGGKSNIDILPFSKAILNKSLSIALISSPIV